MLRQLRRAAHACAAGARRVAGRVRHALRARRDAKAARATSESRRVE
jgi:hypothetical protein